MPNLAPYNTYCTQYLGTTYITFEHSRYYADPRSTVFDSSTMPCGLWAGLVARYLAYFFPMYAPIGAPFLFQLNQQWTRVDASNQSHNWRPKAFTCEETW